MFARPLVVPDVMASRWEWFDYDEDDQKRIRDLLVVGTESDAVDPLRLGAAVRDKVADLLFPGSSTLHRRLRYAIFTPALFRSRPQLAPSGVPVREEQWNKRIRTANRGIVGVFGSQVPSTRFVPAYWNSIRTWGFFTAADRRDATQRQAIASMHAKVLLDDDGNLIDQLPPVRWHPQLLELVDSLLTNTGKLAEGVSVHCTRDEALFVLDRWSSLDRERRPALAAVADSVADGTPLAQGFAYPWKLRFPGALNQGVRTDLASAGPVSLVCWTLHLAYNLELLKQARAADKRGDDTVWAKYPDRIDATAASLERQLRAWQASLSSEGRQLEPWTRRQTWIESGMVARGAPPGTVAELAEAAARLVAGSDDLRKPAWAKAVRRREQLKGFSARLSHPAALAAWTGTPEMAERWDFRWGATKNLLRDIELAVLPAPTTSRG